MKDFSHFSRLVWIERLPEKEKREAMAERSVSKAGSLVATWVVVLGVSLRAMFCTLL